MTTYPGVLRASAGRGRRCIAALGVCLALAHGTPPLAAQSDTKAAATAAFDRAEQFLSAGKLADACLEYAESQRLDPQLGTLLHLADCLEKSGRLASAWAAFREAEELAEKRADARHSLVERRIAGLTPHLSKLQIEVAKDADADHLHIERDNVVVGSALWGAPIPTDPGTHTITVSAPGHHPWTGSAVVRADGSTTVVQVPPLELEVPTSPESSATPKGSLLSARPVDQPLAIGRDRSSPGSTQRTLGWTALGVGAAGLAVGTLFLVQRGSKLSSRDAICSGSDPAQCPPGSQARVDDLTSQARSASTAGAVALTAGGVLAASGLVLLFTAPKHGVADVALVPSFSPEFRGIMVLAHAF